MILDNKRNRSISGIYVYILSLGIGGCNFKQGDQGRPPWGSSHMNTNLKEKKRVSYSDIWREYFF